MVTVRFNCFSLDQWLSETKKKRIEKKLYIYICIYISYNFNNFSIFSDGSAKKKNYFGRKILYALFFSLNNLLGSINVSRL